MKNTFYHLGILFSVCFIGCSGEQKINLVDWNKIESIDVENINSDLVLGNPTIDIGIYFPSNLDPSFKKVTLDQLVKGFKSAKEIYKPTSMQLNLLWIKTGKIDKKFLSTRSVLPQYIKEPLLQEMILCPTLAYGSAWENDVDFNQFVILFRSIFLEGLSRPFGGMRKILKMLEDKFTQNGGELKYRSPVKKVLRSEKGVQGVVLQKGEILYTNSIISCAGYPETMAMVEQADPLEKPSIGKFSFTESIAVLNKKPQDFGQKAATIFYSSRPQYKYENPSTLFETETAILSFPNNFQDDPLTEGMARVTYLANYELWKKLERKEYKEKKEEVFAESLKLFETFCPGMKDHLVLKDVFTPTTIEKFTSHSKGTIYGSPQKSKRGTTPVNGLYLCGTDQGFLGIIGSLLSGISMATIYLSYLCLQVSQLGNARLIP
mgnify:CR=1 FL=1